jgi:hypothetical protein
VAAGVRSIYGLLKVPHLDSDGILYGLSSDAASDKAEQMDITYRSPGLTASMNSAGGRDMPTSAMPFYPHPSMKQSRRSHKYSTSLKSSKCKKPD